jgi:hypothetical protein
MSDAALRIELTRERLRRAMLPAPIPEEEGIADHAPPLFDRIKHFPLIGVVLEALDGWWSNHPLRPVAQVAVEASNAVVQPLAKRSPLALVVGAAVVGAALVWSRPWRWLFGSALFAGLVPQVATRVVSNLPIESWMTMLSAALAQQPTSAEGTPPPTKGATDPPL